MPEFDKDAIRFIKEKKFSMVSTARLVQTAKSVRYAVENNVSGDFVECGVWRGGNAILAKLIFSELGSGKKVYLYDTFAGMTEPQENDAVQSTQLGARKKFLRMQKDTHNEWCYASLESVRQNFIEAGADFSGVKFIEGDVAETLKTNEIPESICLLRLDTDFYESTKMEMEVLYPRLSDKGVLILDDYASWTGARQAVDEYFKAQCLKPLMHVTDSARAIVK